MSSLIELGIDEEELTNLTKRFIKNKKWLCDNYEELRNEYAFTYVAVFDEQIIDFDKDLNYLKKKLEEKSKDPNKILIELINPKEITLIL